jgi:hypothetical protein
MSEGLSRRSLLLGAGGAAAGLAGIHAPAVAGRVSSGEVVAGRLARVAIPDEAEIDASDGAVRVVFARSATFWRDRPAQLAAFVPGDEVVAEGRWAGAVFEADHLVTMFRPVDGRVVALANGRLVTTGGAVRLTPDTRVLTAEASTPVLAGAISEGDEVSVLARREPATGALVAVAVVRSEHRHREP